MQAYREKKYRSDKVFNEIETMFLTLTENEKKINNEHLKMVIEQKFIPLMQQDELFAAMYKKIMYGGSFYKGTKYGKPEEYDLDFVMKLPINYNKITVVANHPNDSNFGYVKIKVDTSGQMHPNWEKHRSELSKWLNHNNFLDQNKFRAWMERVFTSAFSKLEKRGSEYMLKNNGQTYYVRHKKSGPAFTMIILTPQGSSIDVDLVPTLEFQNVPLGNGYKTLKSSQNWMVVTKPLSNAIDANILWRLCFYQAEKELLQGQVKPVIRMLKKFRDTARMHSIASYFIETIFYHELEAHQQDLYNFLRAPKTWLFMLGLRKLKDALESHNLPYFWHHKCNLLAKIKTDEIKNYANFLARKLTMMDKEIETNEYVLATLVLESVEVQKLRMGKNNNISPNIEFIQLPPQPVPIQQPAGRCTLQ